MKRIAHIIGDNILLLLLGIFLIFIIFAAYSSRAYEFVKEYEGIEFRLDSEEFVSETLIFDGMLSNPWIGKTRFEGRLIYGENAYPCILIFKNNFDYIYTTDRSKKLEQIPTQIYITDDFEDIVLVISEKHGNGTSWQNTDGMVFVSSSDNIEDAYTTLEEIVTELNIVK